MGIKHPKLTAALLGTTLLSGLVAGCGSGGHDASLNSFTNAVLRLKYPSNWLVDNNGLPFNTTFQTQVEVSDQRLCQSRTNAGAFGCTLPKTKKPRYVLANWKLRVLPGWSLSQFPGGKPIKIDGLSGKVVTKKVSKQSPVIASREILVVLKAKASDGQHLLTAWVGGPKVAQETSEIMAMARSTRFSVR